MDLEIKKGKFHYSISFLRIWICYFLMPINIYSEYLERITGIGTLFYNIVAFMVLLVISILTIARGHTKIKKNILLYCGAIQILVLIHILLFGNYVNELKQASFIVEFFIVATFCNDNYIKSIKRVIVVIALIMAVDTIVCLPRVISTGYNLYNVRRYTMLDKPYYTLVYPMAIIILTVSLMTSMTKRKRILVLSAIVLLCVVLFGIIGSKTAFVALLTTILLVFSKNSQIKKYVLVSSGVFFVFSIIYLFVLKRNVPDFLSSIVYFIRGDYYTLSYSYANSYLIRFEIVKLAIRTFLRNPIIGCGFNNYYNYVSTRGWQNYSFGNTDVESDFLAIFAEGGIIYASMIIGQFVWLYNKLLLSRDALRKNENYYLDLLGILTCLFVAIIGNDFMSTFFWCLMGMICGIVFQNISSIKK